MDENVNITFCPFHIKTNITVILFIKISTEKKKKEEKEREKEREREREMGTILNYFWIVADVEF